MHRHLQRVSDASFSAAQQARLGLDDDFKFKSSFPDFKSKQLVALICGGLLFVGSQRFTPVFQHVSSVQTEARILPS